MEVMRVEPPTIVPDAVLDGVLAGISASFMGAGHLPNRDLLRRVIDTVFWASQSEEEGRTALTRVWLARDLQPWCRLARETLSVETLRKLSPLLDVDANRILIDENGQIAGIAPSMFGAIGVSMHVGGALVVERSQMVLATLQGGAWYLNDNREFDPVHLIAAAIGTGEDYPLRVAKAQWVLRVALLARSRRRGATLILVPTADVGTGVSAPAHVVEDFHATTDWFRRWTELRTDSPGLVASPESREALAMRLDEVNILHDMAVATVGAGAGIDGGVVIELPGMAVRGFGAKIVATQDDLKVALLTLPETAIELVSLHDLGGMRHQSAARLVDKNHSAMVIVVSQDGPISLVAWVEKEAQVVVVKHVERFLTSSSGWGSSFASTIR